MNTFLMRLKINVTAMLVTCVVIEVLFFPSLDNLYASLLLLIGWRVLAVVCLTQRNLDMYPVSFLMVFGMAVFHYILPLPLTLLDGNPVTVNLQLPVLTFTHHFLFCLTIAFTHKMYVFVSGGKNVFRSVLKNTAFYVAPSQKVIWITALSALASSYYNYFVFGLWQQETADRGFLFYLTTMLSQYIWLPLIMLFPKFIGNDKSVGAVKHANIYLYSVFVVIVAVASNWRTVLFSGVFLIIGLLLISLLFRFTSVSDVLRSKKIIFGLILGVALIGPMKDMAEAMVIVRHERTQLSGSDFLKRTFEVFSDKALLTKFDSALVGGKFILDDNYGWDEHYLSNPILNRMVNLKISDNCLYYASIIGFGNSDMQREFLRQLAALTPNVLLPAIGVSPEEKLDASSYSIGDYLYGLATNSTAGYGSFIISAMPGVGLAIFGYWYFAVVFVLMFIIFAMFDSLVVFDNKRVRFSYLFFVMLVTILNYFNDRHVFVYEFRFVMRTYFETVVEFLIVMSVARFLVGENKRTVVVR